MSLPLQRIQAGMMALYGAVELIDNGEVALQKAEEDDILKGRKAEPIGARKMWGTKEYVKTAQGWKSSKDIKDAHDKIHGAGDDHGIEVGKEYQTDNYGKVRVTKVEKNTGDKADSISHIVHFEHHMDVAGYAGGDGKVKRNASQGINGFRHDTTGKYDGKPTPIEEKKEESKKEREYKISDEERPLMWHGERNEKAKWVRVTGNHNGAAFVSGQALDIHNGDRDKAIDHAKKEIEYNIAKETGEHDASKVSLGQYLNLKAGGKWYMSDKPQKNYDESGSKRLSKKEYKQHEHDWKKSNGQLRIDEETPIMPHIIADSVISESGVKMSGKRADEAAKYLADRADMHFNNNEQFRKQIEAKGDKGRDSLYAFMNHWLEGYLQGKK